MSGDVFILGGKRTAMGQYVGALKNISAIDLGAIAAHAALEATGVAPDEVDHTVSVDSDSIGAKKSFSGQARSQSTKPSLAGGLQRTSRYSPRSMR